MPALPQSYCCTLTAALQHSTVVYQQLLSNSPTDACYTTVLLLYTNSLCPTGLLLYTDSCCPTVLLLYIDSCCPTFLLLHTDSSAWLLLQRGSRQQGPPRAPQARCQRLPQRPQRGWCSPPRMCMPCAPCSTWPTGCTNCWGRPGCWSWTSSTPWTGSFSRHAPPHRYMHVSCTAACVPSRASVLCYVALALWCIP